MQRFSRLIFFIIENKRNKQSTKVESQSPNREDNTSETSFVQCNTTLLNLSENGTNKFDRNFRNELTESSQIGNEIEIISERLTEQNNTKMTQIEMQLNNKFEEILKEFRAYKNHHSTSRKEDAENNRLGPSNLENKLVRRKQIIKYRN